MVRVVVRVVRTEEMVRRRPPVHHVRGRRVRPGRQRTTAWWWGHHVGPGAGVAVHLKYQSGQITPLQSAQALLCLQAGIRALT